MPGQWLNRAAHFLAVAVAAVVPPALLQSVPVPVTLLVTAQPHVHKPPGA